MDGERRNGVRRFQDIRATNYSEVYHVSES